jgi:hypothetical protein
VVSFFTARYSAGNRLRVLRSACEYSGPPASTQVLLGLRCFPGGYVGLAYEVFMADTNNLEQKKHYHERRSIAFPLLLVFIGGFLFLNSINVIQGSTWEVFLRLWPLLIIISSIDGLFQRQGIVSQILWLGIGILLLLWNLDILSRYGIDGWDLLRLWPVLLVAAGLDIVVGHRSIWSVAAGIVVGVALVAGIAWMLLNPGFLNPAIGVKALNQGLDGVTKATVNINNVVSKLELSSLSEQGQLLTGELHLRQGENVTQAYSKVGGRGTYTLENQNISYSYWFPSKNSTWNIRLNNGVPLIIAIKTAVGDQELNFSDMVIENISTQIAVGRIVVTLPQKGNFSGEIKSAVGEVIVYVSKDTPLCVTVNKAVTVLTIPPSYLRDGDYITSPSVNRSKDCIRLNIQNAVGIITIQER